MSRLVWDGPGEKIYETGVKNCVLYVKGDSGYEAGVAWNGITSVSENPSGAEVTDLYADDDKYLSLRSIETFGATIEAYTYPDAFGVCDGSADLVKGVSIGQQPRKEFAICYTTTVGNDEKQNEFGHKLHIIYGCSASPSQKTYNTINDSPEAISFSWEVTTTPVEVTGHKKTATVVIDSTKLDATGLTKLTALENLLYGTNGAGAETGTDPELQMPDDIYDLFAPTPDPDGGGAGEE